MVTVLLILGLGADRVAHVIAGSFTLLAVVWFAIPAWGRDTVYLGLGPSWLVKGHRDTWGESRFSVVPVMLLASAVSILIASAGSGLYRRRRRIMQRIGIPVFAVWFLIVMAVSFSQTTIRGGDPSWTGRVDRVVAADCSGRPGSTIVTVPNLTAIPPPYPRVRNGYYPLVVRCSNLE
ncbi:MAG TPA: hypothetical protein VEJ87_00090 [Acidimicrobiales bacterium]|nr:hypothetical protein [Acidimicrobiales bacterium]